MSGKEREGGKSRKRERKKEIEKEREKEDHHKKGRDYTKLNCSWRFPTPSAPVLFVCVV